jgi:hypothetical protein
MTPVDSVLRTSLVAGAGLHAGGIRSKAIAMTVSEDFDPIAFLANAGLGRKLISLKAKEAFFSQGNPADCVFYLQTDRAKLTVVSESGKEATITLLAPGEFVGEESIASVPGLRLATWECCLQIEPETHPSHWSKRLPNLEQRPNEDGKMYNLAHTGRRPGNPGHFKSEAAAYPSEPLP